jgi:hypothetical protein
LPEPDANTDADNTDANTDPNNTDANTDADNTDTNTNVDNHATSAFADTDTIGDPASANTKAKANAVPSAHAVSECVKS